MFRGLELTIKFHIFAPCSVYIVSQKVKNHRNLYKTFHNLSPFLYWGGLQVKWIMRVLWKFSEEGFVVSGKAHSLIHPYFPSCVKSVFSHSCIYHGMSVSFNMPIPLISLSHTHTHIYIYMCVCVQFSRSLSLSYDLTLIIMQIK